MSFPRPQRHRLERIDFPSFCLFTDLSLPDAEDPWIEPNSLRVGVRNGARLAGNELSPLTDVGELANLTRDWFGPAHWNNTVQLVDRSFGFLALVESNEAGLLSIYLDRWDKVCYTMQCLLLQTTTHLEPHGSIPESLSSKWGLGAPLNTCALLRYDWITSDPV